MSTTRRDIMLKTAFSGAASVFGSVEAAQQSPHLRGKVAGGKLELPPLHGPTETSGSLPNPDPQAQRKGIAIVGLGHLTMEQILPGFVQAKHVYPVAIVSGDPSKARTVAAQYGILPKNIYDYSTFDSIKNNPQIDIVYIVLPNSMHAEYTIRAAAAGKHVLCEKPMANSVRECVQTIDACRNAKRELMIAYRMQYNRLHRKLIEMCRGGQQPGSIRFISAINGQNDLPNRQWRQIKSMAGGGSLPDVGIYCLNAFRYLTGEEPYQVTGQISQPEDDARFREVEDICSFTLRFPSGIIASGTSSYSMHENRSLRIMASDSWFGADPAFSYDNLVMQRGYKAGSSNAVELQYFPPANQFAVEMDNFAQRIRLNKGPLTGGEEGLQDQRTMEAIYHSAADGGSTVSLPRVSKMDSTRSEWTDFDS